MDQGYKEVRNSGDNNIGYYKVLQFSPAGMESYQ